MRGNAPSVLLVDDDRTFLHSASAYAQLKGCEVSTASTVRDATALVAQDRPLDLALIDLSLPDGSGLDIIDKIGAGRCGDVIVVTGQPDLDSALRAMRLRIDDYMVKPVAGSRLDALLERASRRAGLRHSPAAEPERCGDMLGASRAMARLFKAIRRVAPMSNTVLLHGESGTGKELAARAIHALSGREGRFVPVNCGAVTPDLLGSQLFGHERGSFTGAVRDHAGYFEQAQRGTLFLDEFTEMPLPLQAYLLRVLETHEVTRLGAQQLKRLDVRVVAACNRDPWSAVREGRLRADLFYRLCDFPVAVPPLRERGDDAVLLAGRFLDALNEAYGTRCTFSHAAMKHLRDHAWPGNVRELRHAVQRAYVMADGGELELVAEDALAGGLSGGAPSGLWKGQTLDELEREAIEQALRQCGNDKTRAARMLGISVKTIYNKLVRYRHENAG
ncbi:sigma-54 dependent transcriptional regulator [Fulvimonas sp. R45]|uniref:sigma-54-dependent transcriptional regulator n=1 Tax=Fulvimonas sp. R45 TaxID=3045937 RepID=UPI00265FA444|nr:sigma-54 dependent transcriptional regulator [Fulvimonas sp. R45]MDO1527239.1 sigma-54 dependent transcriptional regulator [Fulvimonas sp. R45]